MKYRLRAAATLAALALVAGAFATPAYAVAPKYSLYQAFSEPGIARFGSSVSCSGTLAIAGGRGAVVTYAWYRNAWTRTGRLETGVPTAVSDGYGLAVDMDSGVAVVGAPYHDGDRGAAYVFTYSGSQGRWYYAPELVPTDPLPAGSRFGTSVTVDDGVIVVGASGEDGANGQVTRGAFYVFTRAVDVWEQSDTVLSPNGPAATDWFGHELCLYGDTLVVGAPKAESAEGAAYAYPIVNGSAGSPQLLKAFDHIGTSATVGDHFGHAVTIRGGTMLVGAPGADGGAGSAFVFVKDGNSWVAESVIDKPAGAGEYGSAVSLCTNEALVGAHADAGGGSASHFTRAASTWTYRSNMGAGSTTAGDEYGYAVELYCSWAMVGAPGTSAGAGRVHFHSTSEALPVWRFYNPASGTHFYTDNPDERDNVWRNLSRYFTYEGECYRTNPANNDAQLHRFYNLRNRSHFYTADLDEVARVKATLGAIYQYDGPTYFVSRSTGGEDKTAVHRFYNVRNNSHFYSADPNEVARVQATLGGTYRYEGVAFYLGQ